MATKGRASTRSRRRAHKRIRYFYLNNHLHKVLRIIRAEDFVEAWDYTDGKAVGYIWSDVKKRMEKAMPMQEVSALIGRHRVQIENYILDGMITPPQRLYTLDSTKKPGKYMFSESDVLKLHDYLLTVHVGRPRKDGRITPGLMPSKAELRAAMRHNIVTYVKTGDDTYAPAWKEPDW
jgi:hypothetical protein